MALQRLWSNEEKLVKMPSYFCHNLNISSCDISEGTDQVRVYGFKMYTCELMCLRISYTSNFYSGSTFELCDFVSHSQNLSHAMKFVKIKKTFAHQIVIELFVLNAVKVYS